MNTWVVLYKDEGAELLSLREFVILYPCAAQMGLDYEYYTDRREAMREVEATNRIAPRMAIYTTI